MNDNKGRALVYLESALGEDMRALLKDEKTTEIMVNPDGRVWVEQVGLGMYDTKVRLLATDISRIISFVASSVDVVCNEANPSLAATLPSGERFQGFMGSIVSGPSFVIRRRATQVFTLQDYINQGVLTATRARAIFDAVHARKNILIVGGTGTGKTTLANAILSVISKTNHRIVTIEDTPELQCSAPNHIAFFVREEVGFTWQKAVKDSLRVRPDRIVVGEVRDGSALDLLKAWNTGHNGGCATIHANSAAQGLRRLESLIAEASTNVPRDLIAEAVNLVVHIRRTNEGRVVDTVAEVTGWSESGYSMTTLE